MTKDQFDSAAHLWNGIKTVEREINCLDDLLDGTSSVRVEDYEGRTVVLKGDERNIVLNIIKGYREAELKELKKKFEEI